MKPHLLLSWALAVICVVHVAAACPKGSVPCGGRQSCAPRGGACVKQKCVHNQGDITTCNHSKDGLHLSMSHKLPRSLGQSNTGYAAMPGRNLLQIAGLANFLVGTGVAGFQRAINAAGAASQLANYYGVEGLGMRHRMGALPAPGGLELMALAGPAAMPGPSGFTVGWLGGTVEALAASVNPVSVAQTGVAIEDIASSQGVGQLIGADGLSGLGLGTGLAVTAGLQAADDERAGGPLEGFGGEGPLKAAGSLLQRVGLPIGGALGGGVAAPKQKKAGAVAAGLEAVGKVLGGASNMASYAGQAIKGMQPMYTKPVTIERTVTNYGDSGSSILGSTTDISSYTTGDFTSGGNSYSTLPYSSSSSLGSYTSNVGSGMGSVTYDSSMSSMPSGSFSTTTSSMPISSGGSFTTMASMPVSSSSSFSSVGSSTGSNMYGGNSMAMPTSASSSGWGQSSQSPTGLISYQSVGGQIAPANGK